MCRGKCLNDFRFGTFVGCVWRDGAASMAVKGLIGDGGGKGTESSPAVKLIQIVLFFFFRVVFNFSIMKTLTLLVHAGLFGCFHSPPNSEMDCRIFNVRM